MKPVLEVGAQRRSLFLNRVSGLLFLEGKPARLLRHTSSMMLPSSESPFFFFSKFPSSTFPDSPAHRVYPELLQFKTLEILRAGSIYAGADNSPPDEAPLLKLTQQRTNLASPQMLISLSSVGMQRDIKPPHLALILRNKANCA